MPGINAPWHLPDAVGVFGPIRADALVGRANLSAVETCLAGFDVGAEVIRIQYGPATTRYTLRLSPETTMRDVALHTDEIALALDSPDVRVGAPFPSKLLAWIDATQISILEVRLPDILPSEARLPPRFVALGVDTVGEPVAADIATLAHLFVTGTTGAGKSNFLNCIVSSLILGATPDEVELLLIDTSRVEFTPYNGIPHLKHEVITDPSLAAGALAMITREMDQRYERFAKSGVRKIEEYNAKFTAEKLPYIMVVIDELADLMLVAPTKILMILSTLVESGRAVGIHLVVSVRNLADGQMKRIVGLFPSRIAFKVMTKQESRLVFDVPGAEELRAPGEMLFRTMTRPRPFSAQAAVLATSEIQRLVQLWRAQVAPFPQKPGFAVTIENERQVDDLWYDAAKFLLDVKVMKGEAGVGSTTALQQRFSIGHPRAVRLMKQLEEFGIVGPNEGTKPRNVIIESPADLERISERYGRPGQ